MPRDLPIGNGSLLVNFDSDYYIRDIYYPFVGKENHTEGMRFRFGFWVDGQFAWMTDGWKKEMKYTDETLVTDVGLSHSDLGIKVRCHDCVDFLENILLRKFTITNSGNKDRDVRLFLHHNFHIMESDVGDTALFDPKINCLLHYKSDRYFLMNFYQEETAGVEHYSIGTAEVNDAEGTWRDAEDGVLGMNPIAQGSVDSTMGLHVKLPAKGMKVVYYWMCVGKKYGQVAGLNQLVLDLSPERFINRTSNYWKLWVNKEGFNYADLPEEIVRLYKRSLLVIRTQIDNNGAIIAANDTDIAVFARDTYSYMWPRDGALVAYALDKAGYLNTTERFFSFCCDVIKNNGYFLHKYNPNGTLASSWHPWIKDNHPVLPIQEDETALVVWSLWQHYRKWRDLEAIRPFFGPLVIRTADFMLHYRDANLGLPHASYDLWEERHGILTFTTAAVIAALDAAANLAELFGEYEKSDSYKDGAKTMKEAMSKHLYSDKHKRFVRMINIKPDGKIEEDLVIDASMYAVFAFGVYEADDEKVVNTMQAIRDHLWIKTDVGGVARYQNDYYHQVSKDIENVPGNPWFICTLWLAQYYIARAKNQKQLKEALEIFKWVESHALKSGVLAEQVDPHNNNPLSVSPLTWSHATVVMCITEYLEKLEKLKLCKECGQPVFRHQPNPA